MPIWVINFIYLGVQDGVITGCSNWNATFFSQTFDNASNLRAVAISRKSHFHIQACIFKDIRCVVLIIRLRDFIIVVDALKLFAKIATVINKVCPMVGFGIIPDVSILTAVFHFYVVWTHQTFETHPVPPQLSSQCW